MSRTDVRRLQARADVRAGQSPPRRSIRRPLCDDRPHPPDHCRQVEKPRSTPKSALRDWRHRQVSERWSSTQGSVSIEAVVIIPAFLLFLLLVVAIARVASAQADIHAATVEGARIISLGLDPAAADRAARQAALAHLEDENITCAKLEVTSDYSALTSSTGQSGDVWLAISCEVALADLTVPGLPGSFTLTDRFATPVDAFTWR